MIREQFEELKHTGQLPSPSGVGLKILVLTQDANCSLDEIVQVIQADPALTGRIIKLSTSVQLAGHHQISTVKEAAIRLGLRTVSNVALGFTLISGNRSGRCDGFDYDHYWSWSLANAVAAQMISRELGISQPAEAFTCALLARIGRLALASVHPTEYGDVIARVETNAELELVEVERDHFRIDHRQVAAAMLADWGLPPAFGEAVQCFELEDLSVQLEDPQSYDLVRLLRVSALIAEACVADSDSQPHHWGTLKRICEELDVKAVEFCKLFDKIVEQWTEWSGLLKVPTNDVLPTSELERRSAELERQKKAVEARGSKDGLRVLAVDDDPVSLRLLVRHLENAGHRVFTATNGREALAVALEANPQIVVTDWMMPEMDGIQLCRTLRRYGSGRNLYVLILTGRAEEDRVVEAFEAGVDDYIVKPFKPKLLLARIRGGQRVVRLQERVERDKKTQREQVAKLAVLTRKLRAAAMTDALTDLPNRRYAMKRLDMEWSNSLRASTPFSAITIDIDFFKNVNDTNGHDVGDVVLKETAKSIQRVLRRGDTCARMGGEEFLVICPNTDLEGARQVAERIRIAVARNHIDAGSFSGAVTVSLGVATRSEEADTVHMLLKLSDEAVYMAKEEGRDRVCVYRHSGPDGSSKQSA